MKANHLSDEQILEAATGSASPETILHLRECLECREELECTGAALKGVSQWAQGAAVRTPGFWYAQRRAILEQVAAQGRPARLWAWAGAMATVLLAAVLLAQTPTEQALQQAAGAQAALDPDHALMLEIEDSLRRPVPRPLEPALLVTQELHRAAEGAQSQP